MPSRAVAVAVVVAALVASGRARALEPPPPPRLSFHVVGAADAASAVDEHLRARLEALGLALDVDVVSTFDVDAILATPATDDPAAPLAQAWLDARASRRATLFVVPRAGERVLGRRFPLESGLDEVALSELVYVVERAATALLASEPVGVPMAELDPELREPDDDVPPPLPLAEPSVVVAEPPAEAPPTPSLRERLEFHAGAFLGGESWAAGHDAAEAGLVAGSEIAQTWGRVGLALDVALRRELVASSPQGTVRLGGGSGHALFTLGRRFGRAGTGRLMLGPGLVVSNVGATPAAGAAARTRLDQDLNLGVFLRWDIPLGDLVGLFAVVGADVAFIAGRYTAVVDGVATPLLTTWPIKPLVRLGVSFGP